MRDRTQVNAEGAAPSSPRLRGKWGGVHRALSYLLTLWVVLTLNFILPRLLPGDPLDALFDRDAASYVADDAVREQLAAYYNLDRPLVRQYADYLLDAATGDLGWSIWLNRPVAELIAGRLPWTLLLTLTSLALASLIGIWLGSEAGWRRGGRADRWAVIAGIIASNAPVYVVGAGLLIVFAAQLDWLPFGGSRTPFASYPNLLTAAVDMGRHLILPSAALTLHLVGAKLLLIRNSMVSVLGEDFMLVARAKGLAEGVLKRRHALRNALLPFVAQLGAQMGLAITGAIFIETVFAYPGMGRLIFDAVAVRDYPVLQGAFLVVAFVVLLANLLADEINARLDPRVRSA